MNADLSTAQPITEPKESKARTVAIVMYCILLISYMLMAADRYLFPVLAVDIRRDFHFTLANTGLLTTIFTLGLGLGGLPTGFLLSHFSRKTVMLLGISIFSAGTALTTVVGGFWEMLFCLAVTGIGMAMLATSMFALAAAYFAKYRAAAIGSVNVCYGIGGFLGPIIATSLLAAYATWHAPMLAFGGFGFLMVLIIALSVRPWFSETQTAATKRDDTRGATSLLNRNSILLTVLNIIHGLSMYGFLGMYPTFLRDSLHYSPKMAGFVLSFFGVGALTSIGGGWIGDKFSPRVVLSSAYLGIAVLGYLFFLPSPSPLMREILTFIYGVVGSAVLYVNLAGYHVKAVRGHLASRGSGLFVTSLYGAAAFAGYAIGALASRGSWMAAAELQISLLCIIGAVLSLAIKPEEMAL
ncbi:MAG TPA: MFS transporter [Candidatus Acidoferrales bacterium]|jgi:predicted MFS family arabinose efflux permease|nr:MFS transporter [Candidatus Acidoferrales bacterium]